MADDTQFSALLSSLLSIDNDARTQAEVIFEQIIVLLVEKSIKMWTAREKCASRREKEEIKS